MTTGFYGMINKLISVDLSIHIHDEYIIIPIQSQVHGVYLVVSSSSA